MALPQFILLKPEDHEDELDQESRELEAEYQRIYGVPEEREPDDNDVVLPPRLSPESGPTSVIDQPIFALIDPPSPYDTLEAWERYLIELKKLPENVLLRQESIAQAEQEIRRKREGRVSMARSPSTETNEDRESSTRRSARGYAQNPMSDAERDDRDTEKMVNTLSRLPRVPRRNARDFTVLAGPSKIVGGAYRWIKFEDGSDRVEEWVPGKGWVPSRASPDEFILAPPVSPDFAKRLGIPGSDL